MDLDHASVIGPTHAWNDLIRTTNGRDGNERTKAGATAPKRRRSQVKKWSLTPFLQRSLTPS
jgi:hypothetical protein